MLAAQCSESNEDISSIRMNRVDKPTVSAPAEVVVRVHAAAANPVDITLINGFMSTFLGGQHHFLSRLGLISQALLILWPKLIKTESSKLEIACLE